MLVDDHHLMRQGLRTLINGVSGMRVVAESKGGHEVLEKLRITSFDLLVMDLSMPGIDGFQVLNSLPRKNITFKILVLTMHKERIFMQKAMSLGVDGYILKDDAFEQLISAIQSIRSGQKAFSPQARGTMLADDGAASGGTLAAAVLSKREKEILRILIDGLTNKEVAKRLGISIRTIEAHRASIMRKLGVSRMASLVRFTMENQII